MVWYCIVFRLFSTSTPTTLEWHSRVEACEFCNKNEGMQHNTVDCC